MNNYPKHVGDFIRDTVGLSMLEEGAYNRLLDQYYAREGPLPADKATLYRLARCTDAKERKAVDYVLSAFFTPGPDGWHQKRADAELTRYRERSASAAQSAQHRWNKRNANVMRTHPERIDDASNRHGRPHAERNASQKPVANSQEPRTKDNTPIAESGGRDRVSGPLPRTTDAQGTRLPRDWTLPDDWRCWAEGQGAIDIVGMSEAFRDYWHSRPGAGGRKADWLATWRNWVRKEAKQHSWSGRMGMEDRRAETARVLFGAGANSGREQDERDITGESQRVA